MNKLLILKYTVAITNLTPLVYSTVSNYFPFPVFYWIQFALLQFSYIGLWRVYRIEQLSSDKVRQAAVMVFGVIGVLLIVIMQVAHTRLSIDLFAIYLLLLIQHSYILFILGFSKEAMAIVFNGLRIFLIIISYYGDYSISRNILDAVVVSMLFEAFTKNCGSILLRKGLIRKYKFLAGIFMIHVDK